METNLMLIIAFLVGAGSLITTLSLGAILFKIRKNMKKDKVALVKVYRQVFCEEAVIKDMKHNIPKLKKEAKDKEQTKKILQTLRNSIE